MAQKDDQTVSEEVATPEEIAEGSPVEETAPESPQPEVNEEEKTPEEATKEPEAETPEEEEATPPSRREQLRVADLLNKYGPPPTKRPETKAGIDYSETLEADPEVVKQLEADRRLVSDEAYQQGIQRAETIGWRNNLRLEAPLVEDKFPFLNPRDKQNFRPAVANAMNQKYLRFVGYSPADPKEGIAENVQVPEVSYRDFVEAEMEFVEELAAQKSAESTKNIVKQTAQTGLRPDGSSAKRLNLNQDPSNMSLEELYAAYPVGKPLKQ